MAELDVTIAGRSYRIACEDGQEAHVRALAARLDAEAQPVAAASPLAGEPRLLVMTALMVADRLAEAEERLRAAEAALAERAAAPPPPPAVGADPALAAALDRLEALVAAQG